jgi:TonB-linked SusC/RagA family outer membrane protein
MNKSLKIYAIIVLGIFLTTLVKGQEKKSLHGIVLNDNNQPVSQVTIRIPGGTEPVFTDQNGEFNLPLVTGRDWLVVTPLDKYHEKQLLLNNQDSITIYVNLLTIDSRYDNISLPATDKQRRDMISSYKTIRVDKLEEQPYSCIGQYLQGKVSGAFVTTNSGMPGSGTSMFLRGYSSLLTNNQPLYIVDGVPLESNNLYDGIIEGFNYDPLSTIEPMDISEITILKDAAATAGYGMKGANGVVLIKTLEPKETKTTIDVSIRSGITLKANNLPQLGADQYKHLANEVLFSSGINEEIYKQNYPGLFYAHNDQEGIAYKHNTDWQKEVFSNARMQSLRFSIKGGDAVAKYGLALSYLSNDGIVKNTSFDRINIRLVGSFGIFSWLQMNIASNLTTSASQLKESGISVVTSPILTSLFKSPMLNPYEYDSEGNLLRIIDEVEELGTSNPTAVSELLDARAKNYRFLTTVSLDGQINKNIKFKSVLGLNSNNIKEYLFVPDQGFDLMYNSEAYNVSKAQNSTLFSLYNDNQIYFEKPSYTSNHSINASIGVRWQKSNYQEDLGIGKNTPSDDYTNLQQGFDLLDELGGRSLMWNWGAIYSNASWSYCDKYLLNASVSADISSRIGKQALGTIALGDIPIGLFYSIGGAWRLSEESPFSDNYALEELKLRASYGISGNDDIGETNSFGHYVVDHYRQTSVLVPDKLTNPELTYQNKSQINIGVDLSLFANRLSVTLDYFNNKSKNLLFLEPQNSYMGFDTYPSNSASVATTGFETDVFYRVISKNDFSLDLGFNLSKYNTIVDQITAGEQVLSNYGNLEVINRAGEPVNSFYGYRFLGVYSTQDEADNANLISDRGVRFSAGDAIFENTPDENGELDQVIDKNDKQILGSFEPDFFGGIYLNGRYKNWSLNTFFYGVYGNEVYNYVRYQNEKMTDLSNQSVKVLQRWQYEGQETEIPKATWNDPVGNNSFSDRWIEDGSYLRLKQLTLAYDINRKVLAFKNFKIYITATNLFTLSKYKGYDPEFSYSSNLISQGVDYGKMPMSRQFMIGVKVGL